jgi:hypothetical protein
MARSDGRLTCPRTSSTTRPRRGSTSASPIVTRATRRSEFGRKHNCSEFTPPALKQAVTSHRTD